MPIPSLDLTPATSFGAGALAPYDSALRDRDRRLYLFDASDEKVASERLFSGDGSRTGAVRLDVERFLAAADEDDVDVLSRLRGPLLDVGCGPGRIVKAAILAGHLALGIDVSTTAVTIARERGLPVLLRSIFHDLPSEGTWGVVTLIDGNIGIGGDPLALLSRCAELVDPHHGEVVVETHGDAERDRVFDGIVVDDLARESLPFPWAEVGSIPLRAYADSAGLELVREWTHRDRSFSLFAKRS